MKKIYVFDTSVFLTNFNCIYSYENNDIVIPLKVLDEIDGHKKRQDGVGVNARNTIRILDALREKGNLHKGVKLEEEYGVVSVRDYNPDDLPPGFDLSCADNQIIGTAITEKKKYSRKSVVVVSRDINMRVKCDALGIPCEDYSVDQLVDSTEDIYTGLTRHLVDDEIIDRFYSGDEIFLEEEDVKLYPNQYVMLISNFNEKKTALARFMNYSSPLARISERRNGTWGLRPRNKEQSFAIDLLMDPSIQVITMIGKAGCGKTLLAIAAGLEQTLENDKIYKKLVVSRPIQPLGNDIGFLPGTLEDKMSPWLMPIQDNLEFLFGSDKTTLEMLFENGTIEMEALTYIRGRSISNAFIIIDEAQNLSLHELKTIITRVGEGTKIILTGDVEQIDNVYLDATTNGLSYAIERFKDQELAGHITLIKGERSKVATLAAKIL